jgi:hypothetical protein
VGRGGLEPPASAVRGPSAAPTISGNSTSTSVAAGFMWYAGREAMGARVGWRCASPALVLFGRSSCQLQWFDRLSLLSPDAAAHLANANGADRVSMPVLARDQMEQTQDARHSIQGFSRAADSAELTSDCGGLQSPGHPWTVDPIWVDNHGSSATRGRTNVARRLKS